MEVSRNVGIPKRQGKQSKFVPHITKFLASNDQNICFTFDEYQPTKRAYKTLHMLGVRYGFKAIMRGWSVYCVKEEKKKDVTDED